MRYAAKQLGLSVHEEFPNVDDFEAAEDVNLADGELVGPKGRALSVVTIWLRWRLDDRVRFVTLKPRKEKRK